MATTPPDALVGQEAPLFTLPSVQGGTVALASYRGLRNVILWFSRGFTCPFCRTYMDSVIQGYQTVLAADCEVIQIAPNLLESARTFFRQAVVPYPFICDPDKRLYAIYGLGDRGALEATKTALVSFAHAFKTGDNNAQFRGAFADVMNRNFIRRLHHHAATAFEQGLFFVDRDGVVRHRSVLGPIDSIPGGSALAELAQAHCMAEAPSR